MAVEGERTDRASDDAPVRRQALTQPSGVVSLPLYDWPETRDALDEIWRAWRRRLADSGRAAPERLVHDDRDTEATYGAPVVLATQICGYRIATDFAGRLTPFAAPAYRARGCEGPTYSSWIVMRRGRAIASLGALLSGRVARNGPNSFSGWVALGPAFRAARAGPASVIDAGSHRAAARAVAEGAADAAAIDAYCLRMLQRFEPETASRLTPVAQIGRAPAPPFAASDGGDRRAMAATLIDALHAPETAEARAHLDLIRAEPIDADAYRPMGRIAPP